MKATLELPDALYREVKIRAAQEGVKIKDLVVDALQAKLHPVLSKPESSGMKKKSIFPMFHGPAGPLLAGKDVRSLSFLDDQDDLERYQRSLRR